MGGYGSGRYGGRPTVESGLTLDINRLLRQRNMIAGNRISGSLVWSRPDTGENVASISYDANLTNLTDAWVRLLYSKNGIQQDYRVEITSSPCRFGGRRWWWLCPRSGRRVAKLHLPPGAPIFAARQFYRLPYESQRDGALERSHTRQRRLFRKLGEQYEMFEQPLPKRPKGMHRRTYERLKAEIYAAMDVHEAIFEVGAAAFLTRSMLRKPSRAQGR